MHVDRPCRPVPVGLPRLFEQFPTGVVIVHDQRAHASTMARRGERHHPGTYITFTSGWAVAAPKGRTVGTVHLSAFADRPLPPSWTIRPGPRGRSVVPRIPTRARLVPMSPKPAHGSHGPALPKRPPGRSAPPVGGRWRGLHGDRDAWPLVPLRTSLGVTFVYAGLQTLADRWFFQASAPSSLQSQLRGAARTSPVGGLVGPVSHHAVLVGLVIAFGEVAVGLGTLLGLWARAAAAGGLIRSAAFLLTVSWHSRLYYYGADVVFLFAWTPLLVVGAGRLSVDAAAARRARAELGVPPALPVTIGFEPSKACAASLTGDAVPPSTAAAPRRRDAPCSPRWRVDDRRRSHGPRTQHARGSTMTKEESDD